jgi:hypothetical protein
MSANHVRSPHDLAAALERGEVIHYPVAPFPLPQGEEQAFLLTQRLAALGHKNISYDPETRRVAGFIRNGGPDQVTRLAGCFQRFSETVTAWLQRTIPAYADGLHLDMVSLRPEEEATRRLRTTARNDLLHVDAFPNRPTRGDRILRVFANINREDPRVWMTSDPFSVLLQRHGKAAGLPGQVRTSWLERVKDSLRRIIKPGSGSRSAYDSFMLRLHDYLKHNDHFQEQCAKTLWHFQPGCVWMAMTDACSHAVLRGRYALEHSYFVSRPVLVVPEESPIALLERMCAGTPKKPAPPLKRAA